MKPRYPLLANPIIHVMLFVFWVIWFSWSFFTESFSAAYGIGYITLFFKWGILILGLVLLSRRHRAKLEPQHE